METQEYFYDDGADDLDYIAHRPHDDYGDEDGVRDFETVSSLSRLSAITDAILLSADPELGAGRILSLEPPQPDEGSIDRPMQPPIRSLHVPRQTSSEKHAQSPIDTIVAIRPMVTMGPKKEDPTFDTVTFGDGVLKVRRGGAAGYAASDKSTDDEDNSAASCDSNHAVSKLPWRRVLLLLMVAFITGASVAYFFTFYVKPESEDTDEEGSLQPEIFPQEPAPVNTERDTDLDFTPPPSISLSPIQSPAVTMFPTITQTDGPTALASATPTEKPSPSPTMSPTPPPTTLEEGILSVLSTVDFFDPTIIGIPSSPQNLAYQFLLETTKFSIHTPHRIIQRYVMAVFYHATNGSGWEKNNGWLELDNECQWYSTEPAPCHDDGQLVRLNLPSNNLIGELPSELGFLDSLVRIAMGGNDIMGQIPTTLGNLKNLQVIDLSWTDIDGSIPSSLGEARSLESINFVGTSVMGSVPPEIGGLAHLDDLLLAKTKISGPMPEQICDLGLQELWADCDAVPCPCCNYCCYRSGIHFCQYV